MTDSVDEVIRTPMPPLPDELVKNILEPLLNVPHHVFNSVEKISPFASPSESRSSDFLLVCKQWMRVATPLLYNVVILRSKAQAQSLERTLRDYPAFGRFTSKLRVEGGFGALMHKIIVASPNIKHLFVSLELWADDSVSGLMKALPLLHPVRVTLKAGVDDKSEPMVNKCVKNLIFMLCKCIKEDWHSLDTFYFPYNSRNSSANLLSLKRDLILSLVESPSLTTLEVGYSFVVQDLKSIAQNKNLKRIFVNSLSERDRRDRDPFLLYNSDFGWEESGWLDSINDTTGDRGMHKSAQADEVLSSLIVYEQTPAYISPRSKVIIPLSPIYAPMSSASDVVQDKIWARIIYFATEPDYRPKFTSSFDRRPWRKSLIIDERGRVTASNRNRLFIASVCKQFWHLAESRLYQDPELGDVCAIAGFSALMDRTELASHVRTLAFRRATHVHSGGYLQNQLAEFDRALEHIIINARGIVEIKQSRATDRLEMDIRDPVPWSLLARCPKRTITRLGGISLPRLWSGYTFMDVLDGFNKLVQLDIEVTLGVRLQDDDGSRRPDNLPFISHSYYLPMLERLSYGERPGGCINRSSSSESVELLLSALSKFELPSMNTLNLRTDIYDKCGLQSFLFKHGRTILHANLASSDIDSGVEFLTCCENIQSIVLHDGCPPGKLFDNECWPESLKSVKVTGFEYLPYASTKQTTKEWLEFFPFVRYLIGLDGPLRELHVDACVWPATERELLKGDNLWIKCSVHLLERYNIKLTDADGNHWVPRLSTTTKKSTRLKG